jgi:hypothetical protein
VPNSSFGSFNPFAEPIRGDWFDPRGRAHHRGGVFAGDQALTEAVTLEAVLAPPGPTRLWFAQVDGTAPSAPEFLLNLSTIRAGNGAAFPAAKSSAKSGTQNAPCSEGGECVGFIRSNDWLRFDGVDFGAGTEQVEIRGAAIAGAGGDIELRVDTPDGELLGTCEVAVTGDWQKWESFPAKIAKTSGVKNLCLVFKPRRAPKPGTDNTVIHAQFPDGDPNQAPVAISMRPTVFSPSKTNIDFITVRGFKLCNAATNWCAPTMGQVGLVTAYWCKGWVIENNEILNARCSGIALGKYSDEWDFKRGTTEGYYLTIDDAFKKDGWSKDKIGSHVVRNNHIHHCGQNGIVGSLGCAFSRIVGNEIHDINVGDGFWGAEMGGIKFHGAIDTVIHGNHIYRCGQVGGIWLDWMTQGTQITANLFHDNHPQDLFFEVDHGPYLVANNIFLSPQAHLANSRGGAYVHNLVAGSLKIIADGRRTPFMKAHSTESAGLRDCPIGDVRWHNNLLAGRASLNAYDGATLPVSMSGNVFTAGSHASKFEAKAVLKPGFDPGIKLVERTDGWYLSVRSESKWPTEANCKPVTSAVLGKALISNLPFENPDGSSIRVVTDYFGHKRRSANPAPGPFETSVNGEIKVWPKE